ncbi:TNT domain-containing protein [Spirillospora sp. NPDC048824]|uniref:TNT domain-containing protein n=1 Tax=Spirillospora sp. NPDC048824 TaxID=3364526 RepID=UPI003712F8A1
MTNDPETTLLQQLIDEVTGLLPDTWTRAELTYRAIGDHEVIYLTGNETGRSYPSGIRAAGRRIPRTGIPGLLRRHREITYHPDQGTWPSFSYKLRNKNGVADWGVSARPPAEFAWTDEITPADCAAELQRFPRPDGAVPEWMRSLLDLHHAARTYSPVPQRESDLVALLPPGMEQLFMRARVKLADFVPGAGTLRIGAPGEGHWTVAHTGDAWLAVAPGGDAAPYAEPHRAVAHAMAGVMTDAGMEINSAVLSVVQIITGERIPRDDQQAWTFGDVGRELSVRRSNSPRPDGTGPYIHLDPLHNRPEDHFVCFPGAAPEEGAYVSVHEVLMMLAESGLPAPAPEPEAAPEPPSEVLETGREVDAYGDPANCFVYTIGTPFLRRGLWGAPSDYAYHVYRVEKPIRAHTGLFAPGPLGSDPSPPDTGMGFYLADSIADLVASGHLAEITGDRAGH